MIVLYIVCINLFILYRVLTFLTLILAFMLILKWNTKVSHCCMYLNDLVLNKSVKRNNETD